MEQLDVIDKKIEAPIGKVTFLTLEGSVNSYTYSDFQDKLYSLVENTHTCIDMSKVVNLSSAGLGVLMSAMETAEENGFRLYIMNPSNVVDLAINSTGFREMFLIIDSPDQMRE
ncbi:MAG: STAS domain-containing protein [Spirochaetia bacterium]